MKRFAAHMDHAPFASKTIHINFITDDNILHHQYAPNRYGSSPVHPGHATALIVPMMRLWFCLHGIQGLFEKSAWETSCNQKDVWGAFFKKLQKTPLFEKRRSPPNFTVFCQLVIFRQPY
ncbi:hypothetical protein [Komagataeibacter diospyri]|uniref:hypothetical protein n=1 Tax=Komagataeibacter diospyri TaxID=1932662 RepID=UPI0011432541|nr:hypothetical protein [Komagataeibacter diospyri]